MFQSMDIYSYEWLYSSVSSGMNLKVGLLKEAFVAARNATLISLPTFDSDFNWYDRLLLDRFDVYLLIGLFRLDCSHQTIYFSGKDRLSTLASVWSI